MSIMASPQKSIERARAGRHGTGPRTARGKARSKLNAWRHGLAAVRLPATGAIDRDAERLAEAIAGPNPDACRLYFVRIAAEAELELRRVRAVRLSLLAATMPAGLGASHLGHQKPAPASRLPNLPRLDRYEQRALSRRNRALRLL
jgi:hypothetical protein